MRRLALMLMAALMPLVAEGAEMQAVLPGGLHGTFTLPDGEAAVPVAFILPGSGPVDRDGNLPGAQNDSLKKLAEGLDEQGIATLRVDKRGIGASRAAGLREEDLRFDTYVSDAVAWLGWLSGQKRAGALYLIGHNEGALVATLAAKRHEVSGLVLLAGAGFRAGRVIERQLAGAGLPAHLQEASRRILSALEAGGTAADVPPELAPLYRESVQPYLISWLPLDPAEELKAVSAPVLLRLVDIHLTARWIARRKMKASKLSSVLS